MEKGSADIFGNRMCNSMLSNRNSKGSIKHNIGTPDNLGDKNGKLRGSMLTPR
jgi:hypothetical protein